MATAVSAWFDEASEQIVRDLWRQMAEAELDGSLYLGPYRPHLTLGVWEALPAGEAAAAAQAIAATVPQQPIAFQALGAFVDPEPAVFLAPTVTFWLRAIHERLHELVRCDAKPIDDYVPDAWNPHCTLAWRLKKNELPEALALTTQALSFPLSQPSSASA